MEDKTRQMSEIFKALGDPTRLKIIWILSSNMKKKLCVAGLAKKLGITQPAVSQHIRVLKNIGILEPNRVGFRVHYNINEEVLKTYKADIDRLFNTAFKKIP